MFHFVGPSFAYFHAGQVMSGVQNDLMLNFYGAIAAFVADAVVTVIVTLLTPAKPLDELRGLVWGLPDPNAPDPYPHGRPKWYGSPKFLGGACIAFVTVLSIVFA